MKEMVFTFGMKRVPEYTAKVAFSLSTLKHGDDRYIVISGGTTEFFLPADDLREFLEECDSDAEVSTALYDSEEIHENCTVQILRNSVTGKQSIGWWENEDTEKSEKV